MPIHAWITRLAASYPRIMAACALALLAGFTTACPGGGSDGPSIVCAPGEQADGNTCVPCECGSYCPDGETPIECDPGRFNAVTGSVDAGDCLPCALGTAAGEAGSCACTDCDPGEFNAFTGSSSCTECPAGTFSDTAASTECTLCSPGRFQPTTGNSNCLDCDPGRFAANQGSSACTDCAPGRFQPSFGSSTCIDCAPLQFQPNSGSSACESCMCDDLDPMTTDSCDPMNGTCMNVDLMTLEPQAMGAPLSVSSAPPAVPSLSPIGLGVFIIGLASSALLALRDPEE